MTPKPTPTANPTTPFDEKLTYAQQIKDQAIANAELAKQQAIVDAATSYEKNKASYGAKADQLASMGLTGSGYSDYLDSKAYAAYRSDVQAANKLAQDATTYAQNEYNKAVLGINDEKATYEQGLIDLSSNNYLQMKDELRANAFAYSDADIDDYVSRNLLSTADAEKLKQERKSLVDNEFSRLINSDTQAAGNEADKLFSEGRIDKNKYQSVYKSIWEKDIQGIKVGALQTTVSAIEGLKTDYNEGKISQSDYLALLGSFGEKMGVAKIEGGKAIIGNTSYRIRSNFLYREMNEILNAMSGNPDLPPAVGSLVKYDGFTYIYSSGRWKKLA
jgi:hypothetical protein